MILTIKKSIVFICLALLLGPLWGYASIGDNNDVVSNPITIGWGFLENQGQWADEGLFRGSGSGFSLKFLPDGVAFMSAREDEHEEEHEEHGGDIRERFSEEDYEFYVWKMRFEGGADHPEISKGNVVAARTSFFLGDDPEQWKTKVPEYDELIYRGVWPGIDVRFFLTGTGALKYEFLLAPGADPEDIRISFEGLDGLEIQPNGQMQLLHPWGPVTEDVPTAFTQAKNQDIAVQFKQTGRSGYGFSVASPPQGEAWVIDPLLVHWSSFVNANGFTSINYSHDVSYDDKGCLYITGRADPTFPATPGSYQSTAADGVDAYVAKFSPDGSTIMAMSYLGGTNGPQLGTDFGWSVSVSDSGRVFVSGESGSDNFPTTPGAMAAATPFGFKPWVACFDTSLTSLIYSTMACDSCRGSATGIRFVSGNEAIVVGYSEELYPFVASPGAFMDTHPGGQTVWVMRLNATGSSMNWATHFGSDGTDFVNEIDVNDLEEPYFVGHNTGGLLPVTPGVFGGVDSMGAYIARLNATGTSMIYCSVFGNPTGDLWGVDVNPVTREAFIAGYEQPDTFVVFSGSFQPLGAGGMEATVARINATGTSLIYATYLGGMNTDQALSIATNSIGEAYVTGVTNSPDFPTTACQLQAGYAANYDMFITHLNPSGTAMAQGGSSFYGGAWDDYFLTRIELRDDGPFDTLFCTLTSHSPDFPTTPNSFLPIKPNTTGDCPTAFKILGFGTTLLLDTTNCDISSLLVQAPTLTTNILWSNSDTTSSIVITQSGQYWLTGDIYGCSYSDTFDVVVNELFVDLGPDTSFCENVPFSLPLSAGSGDTWVWQDATNAPNITATAPGIYWVEARDANTGCTYTDSLEIFALPEPVINLTAPPLCAGVAVQIEADPGNNYPGASYLWSTGDTTGQISISTQGWVWVDLTSSQGCTTRDSIFITNNPLPNLSLGPDTTVCDQPSLSLNAGAGYADYLWSDNSTGQSTVFSQPGWVWVVVTDTNGCTGQDSLLLGLGTLPVPQLGPDQVVCEGQSVTFTSQLGGSGFGYNWSNGTSSSTLTVGQGGTYWIEVTELASGCMGRDSIELAVFPFPDPGLEDTLLCDQDSLVLDPGAYQNYLWSEGSTAPTLTITSGGGYAVTVTTGNCSDSTGARVVFSQSPATDLGPDLDLCLEDRRTLFLTAESGNTVLWSNGSTDWSMDFTETGEYWAEMTNECGTVRDSIRVNFAQEFIEPFIPNVFTPNGDGISDCFLVENPEVQSFLMQIFDRWGRLMYETQNINDCWNGLYRSRPAPEGAYVCIVRLRACNGELLTKSEMITLMR